MGLDKRKIELTKLAHGLEQLNVPVYRNGSPIEGQEQQYQSGEELEAGTIGFSNVEDTLGVPVFDSFTLRYEEIEVVLGTTVVDVTQSKRIVETSIVGQEGTVKEFIAKGDYTITIRGIVINEKNQYPWEQLSELQRICAIDRDIEVDSEFLQLFGVFNLVIKEYNISREVGSINAQAYELTCVSDKPIELIID